LLSLVCLALFLRVWQPQQVWTFAGETKREERETKREEPLSARAVVSAWVPWLLLTAFVFAWGLPAVKEAFAPLSVKVEVPALHRQVVRTPPVVPTRQAEDAVYDFNPLATTGTGIFLAAVASAVWLGVSPGRFLRVLGVTVHRLRWPLFTIACMLAIAFTTRYSGLDATLGLAFTRT